MTDEQTKRPIAGVLYNEASNQAELFAQLASKLRGSGLRLAGIIQHDLPRPGRTRCDMILEDLATGRRLDLSSDRGPEAKGCRMDLAILAEVSASISTALASGPIDVLIVNKFGKIEAEGGGLRGPIAEALELGVPIVVGVPDRNLAAFQDFAQQYAEIFEPEERAILDFAERQRFAAASNI